MAYHVSKEQFAELVEAALAELPEQFSDFLEQVPIEIRDRPTRKQLRSAGLDEDQLLLGLYVGTSVADRSVMHDVQWPNKIYLFQEDIELISRNERHLKEEVRKTVLHEIGHHFGMDEDDLDEVGYG